MPRLVEDAGGALSAGWLSRFTMATGLRGGVVEVGGREVEWELAADDAVTVAHRSGKRGGKALRYTVGLVFTGMPCGGPRWWWSCPACGGRVDALYLPADRDRLACRRCCGLAYRSQYPRVKGPRRKRRSDVAVTREPTVWTAARGWVLLSWLKTQM